ncbi:MAG: ribonuclease III family protein [Candidatus Thorarchaeota archaeon]
MPYEFLLRDINKNLTEKAIGTDKGLAKIGDGIVNLAYSVAKSTYLTRNNVNNRTIRTGMKVGKNILAEALKEANMKSFAKNRADSHDLADTVESLIAYVWLSGKMSIKEITDFLANNFSGDLNNRVQEINSARQAFTKLLNLIKKFIPVF